MHNTQSPAEVTDRSIEAEIRAKGLTAPRVTPAHIEAAILTSQFFVFPGTTTTVCCITLKNGFTVTGESACASPENFDEQIGQRIAYEQAKQKIWSLEGYYLKCQLHIMAEIERQIAASTAKSAAVFS